MGLSQFPAPTGLRLIGASGAVTSALLGSPVSITPGDSSAYGSWTAVSTSAPSDLIMVAVSARMSQSTSDLDARRVRLQVGVGAAASESAVASSFVGLPYASAATGGVHGCTFFFPVPPTIAAGARISVRGSRDTSTSAMTWTVEALYVPLSALA